jgi:lipoate-protein ligase A
MICHALRKNFEKKLGVELVQKEMTPKEEILKTQLMRDKYMNDKWNLEGRGATSGYKYSN